jgi:catechol 2,3-dioxygenase-like lactoylglutathione lyase family enzyme
MAHVRYLVTDVQKAVDFYSTHLGFTLQQQWPAMAILKRADLTLWLAGPNASASRPMPDGRKPEPGGWNRFVEETDDLAAMTVRIYARTGTHVGFESDADAWALIGSAAGVSPDGEAAVPVPIAVNWNIAAGATAAFYVTSTGGASVSYHLGSSRSTVARSCSGAETRNASDGQARSKVEANSETTAPRS